MTPPSLDVAREILIGAAAKGRASGDPSGEIAASAIDVVLAEIDRRPAPMEPMPALEPRGGAARCQQNYGAIQCQHDAGHAGDHVSFQLGSRRAWSDVQLDKLRRDHGAITVADEARAAAIGPALEPALAPRLDAQMVRVLGRGIGYGRLMQLVDEQWRAVAGDGSERTVGPCAGLLVPCVCTQGGPQPCAWCEGARRVTQRVRNAIEAMRVDEATGTATATPGGTSPA